MPESSRLNNVRKEREMSKKFWTFQNQTGNEVELLLYGDISQTSWWGDEVTPRQFADELAGLGALDKIVVRINSGGGDVFAAQAIGNQLEQHPAEVTAKIDGLCASAATIVACHCNKVVAANDATYMVHPVRIGACGYYSAEELRKYAEALATIKENIVNLYVKKTGRDMAEVTTWMDATSWWTATAAKENGFVDELADDEEGATYENRDGTLFVNGVGMNLPFGMAPKFVQDGSVKKCTGRLVNKKPAGRPEKQEAQDVEIKTVDELRGAYPALVDRIEQEARNQGAEGERKRIQDIEDMALPGSEAIAADAKFANPVSVEDFAKAMVKNAKTQGAAYLEKAKQDAEKSGVNAVTNAADDGQGVGDSFLNAIKSVAPKR